MKENKRRLKESKRRVKDSKRRMNYRKRREPLSGESVSGLRTTVSTEVVAPALIVVGASADQSQFVAHTRVPIG